jgi:hypothetical protein
MLMSSVIRVKTQNDYSLWIVSPWLSDVYFNFVGRSSFSGIFPTPRKTIKLSEVLTNFLDYGGRIKLICRPPHDLVDVDNIRMLIYIENSSFPRRDLIVYKLVDSIMSQKSTIDFLLKLFPYYDLGKFELKFSERLHAKIFLSESFALTGSSNITYSGLFSNIEFNFFVFNKEQIEQIKQFCNEIWSDSVDFKKYIKSNEFCLLLENLKRIKDKFDPRLKDLYIKLEALCSEKF